MTLALSTESNIKRADPSTIQNKFLVGYQGWFYCHGDGEPVGPGHHGWIHWFTYPVPDGGAPNFDPWPDLSEYSPSELYPAPGFKHLDGSQAYLFSSRHPKTVQRHFHWMATNGVDGAFLQRFVGLVHTDPGNEGIRAIRDEVGDRVKEACEKEGRVFAIMYDVAGVAPERIQEIIEYDWKHLIHDKGVLDSPNYLHEKGKPVIAIWGLGFNDQHHTPELMRSVTNFLRTYTPGGAYIMAGAPAHWRSSKDDSDRNPEFVSAWMESFDAISPWTVGRFSNQQEIDNFKNERVIGDFEFIAQWEKDHGKHVDYVPVVHPGGSGEHISRGQWPMNGAPRAGGRFLWRQMYNMRKHGAQIMYGAMWDEYDEGTNFLPVVSQQHQIPHDEKDQFKFMALDVDGYVLPSDWYMRIAGYAAEALKGERQINEEFPEKELKDWTHSHPNYEDAGSSSAGPSGSGGHQGQSYQEWLQTVAQTKEGQNMPPPPPYTLEADETQGAQSVAVERPQPLAATRPQAPAVPQGSRPVSSSSLADAMAKATLSSYAGQGPVSPHPPPSPHSASRPLSSFQGQAPASPQPSMSRMSSYAGQGPPSPRPPSRPASSQNALGSPPASGSSYPGQGPPVPPPPSSRPVSSYPGQGPPSPRPPTQPGFALPTPDFSPWSAPQQAGWPAPAPQWGVGPPPPPQHYQQPPYSPGSYPYPGNLSPGGFGGGGFMPVPQPDVGYGGYGYGEPAYGGFPQAQQGMAPLAVPPPPPVPPRPQDMQAPAVNYSPTSPPPPPPTRPVAVAHTPSSSSPPPPPPPKHGGVGHTASAAGDDRRKSAQQGVGGLVKSGSKFFSRFTKS